MARPGTQEPLLDAAERLFAQHGIANVSDRKVAEQAGNSNKSAVAYYFGGRQGLLQALVDRHLDGLEPPRRALFEESRTLLGDVRALVLPVIGALAALPVPSWRARFMDLAAHDPTTTQILLNSAERAPAATEIFESIVARLDHLDHGIVVGRASMMTYIIAKACAEIEQRGEAADDPTAWSRAGHFLCDAITGMLEAPVSQDR